MLFEVQFRGWRLTWALPAGCREAQTFWGGWRQGLGGQLRVAHFIQHWVASWRLWGGGWEAGQNWSIHNLRMGSGASCCTCKGLTAGGKPESGALFTCDWQDGPRGDFCLRHRAAIPYTRATGQVGSSGGWKVSDTKRPLHGCKRDPSTTKTYVFPKRRCPLQGPCTVFILYVWPDVYFYILNNYFKTIQCQ